MKSNTSIRLKQLMNDRNLRQIDILRKAEPYSKKYDIRLGRNDISQYVSGKVEPSQEKLTILSLALGVTEPWLMGYDVPMIKAKNVIDISDSIAQKIPILGTIACGEPIWVYENFDGYFITDTSIKADFIVKAKGDSMVDAGINDGDLVFLKKTPTVDNGKIGAVLVENEATLKKVIKTDNAIILQPCNSSYQPMVLTENEEIMILG